MDTPRTVLIVEDEMIISLHMEDTLQRAGHRVVSASSVTAAQHLLDAGGIDLAVIDYHVTDGDTDRLMQRLNERGVQFLICSGLLADGDESFRFGKAPVLAKPFTTESLIAAIAALIGEPSSK